LVDFGLARFADQVTNGHRTSDNGESQADVKNMPTAVFGVTASHGKFVGTPSYMAPEQLIGQPIDEKTDQYSFCVALFRGLYGKLPFNAESVGALLEQIKHRRVNAVPKSSRVPYSLHRAISRGLSPNPEDRFSSMKALLDQLEQRASAPSVSEPKQHYG
jgi:serine/threonine protein kinase